MYITFYGFGFPNSKNFSLGCGLHFIMFMLMYIYTCIFMCICVYIIVAIFHCDGFHELYVASDMKGVFSKGC